mgnify:CR=1 FL=1
MGDKEKYLNEAVEKLQQTSDCQVLKVSDFLVTAPYGGVEQDDFLNGALALKTLLTPQELLERLHEIEQEAHRERLIHWGPRTLDLDILLYDDLVLDTPDLIIPHVEMHLRDFVLIPLAQIAPWKRHPLLGLTVSQLLADLQAKQKSGSAIRILHSEIYVNPSAISDRQTPPSSALLTNPPDCPVADLPAGVPPFTYPAGFPVLSLIHI